MAPAAPTSLSTYKPAPIIGESPTLPGILYAKPLVVVIPATLLSESIPKTFIVPVVLISLEILLVDIHFLFYN